MAAAVWPMKPARAGLCYQCLEPEIQSRRFWGSLMSLYCFGGFPFERNTTGERCVGQTGRVVVFFHGKSGSKTLKRTGWEHKMSGFRSGNGLRRMRMEGEGVYVIPMT